MKAIKYTTILAVLAVIFNACTKDVAGPTGPRDSKVPKAQPLLIMLLLTVLSLPGGI